MVADRLIELGLYDEAAPEMEVVSAAATPGAATAASWLSALYERGDHGDRAMAFMEPIWRTMPADYPIELMPAIVRNALSGTLSRRDPQICVGTRASI